MHVWMIRRKEIESSDPSKNITVHKMEICLPAVPDLMILCPDWENIHNTFLHQQTHFCQNRTPKQNKKSACGRTTLA